MTDGRFYAKYSTIALLQQELAQLKEMIFGSRQEKLVVETTPNQLSLGIAPERPAVTETIDFRRIEYIRTNIETTPLCI
ncbi:hypothetical protein [Chitinophaga sp. S165]|uniref:hypothetical protein n=1 Tax=Chitinophaga sp. S165 TaxID=2135462 RepID=UPI000D719515|nr:hypothetical protein [Chitinophaga sp. S165]PWV48105.1 transposase IS166 family protein [Chitinophaga sp. S165]